MDVVTAWKLAVKSHPKTVETACIEVGLFCKKSNCVRAAYTTLHPWPFVHLIRRKFVSANHQNSFKLYFRNHNDNNRSNESRALTMPWHIPSGSGC